MYSHALRTHSSAAASFHAPASPSFELLEARQARDDLANLLATERTAAAEFLLALSDFDRRRGWEPLGHASLFAFLHVELGLSKGGAFFRQAAVRLVQRCPEVIEPLRDGRLCITSVVELAKVLTEANRADVLPRFFGLSSREAKDVVAELMPMASPPVRTVMTPVTMPKAAGQASPAELPDGSAEAPLPLPPAVAEMAEVQSTEPPPTHTAREPGPRPVVEPLTAELRRLHVTVGRQFLQKLGAARDGLSHALPGATTEQVLEAALDQLLEKQARARGLVKRPRKVVAAPTPAPAPMVSSTAAKTQPPASASTPPPIAPPASPLDLFPTEPPRHRRTGPRKAIPAAVFRAVWARDGGRCSWPLDGGGVCGTTYRLELDHIDPWARWGGETVDDLRVVCHPHNALAARQAFGERWIARYSRSRKRARRR